jgi:hypothetical protein
MILKLSTWLAVAITGAALVAGCGSSSESTSSQAVTRTHAAALSAQQRVAACKHGFQVLSSVSASTKTELERKFCEKPVATSPTAQKQAVQQACVELVKAFHVPAGVARERAVALCKAK